MEIVPAFILTDGEYLTKAIKTEWLILMLDNFVIGYFSYVYADVFAITGSGRTSSRWEANCCPGQVWS